MKKGIAVCGNIFLDHVKRVDVFPEEGMLANIKEEDHCVGGCVSNTIINLSKLETDIPLYAVGCVGKDSDGEYLLKVFQRYCIDTQFISVKENGHTGFTDAIISTKNQTRTFFNMQGVNSRFGEEDIPETLNVKIAHIGYALLLDALDQEDLEYGTVMARVLAKLQKKGIKTSIDVVSEDGERFQRIVIPALKYCSYLIINEIEAGMIAGISAREENGRLRVEVICDICKQLLDYGVKDCVIIHCPEAGFYMDAKQHFYQLQSLNLPKEKIVSSVGAGDAFCAGSLYGLYHELEPLEILTISRGVAAASLMGDNSINGLCNLNQVYQLNELYGK